MLEMIEECRQKLGDPPRIFSAAERKEFSLRPSVFDRFVMWLTGDKLRAILRAQAQLRDEGRIVWGHLVQANNKLFDRKNREMFPGAALYSPDQYFDERVDLLEGIAKAMFELKGTRPDHPNLRRFADIITDERERALRLQVPEELCEGRTVYFTTLLIQPTHLPRGYLNQSLFPLIVLPEKTGATMILPAQYWGPQLVRLWDD